MRKKTKTDCFPVADSGKIIGVLTRSDLIKSNPNRIGLDAMSGRYKYINFGYIDKEFGHTVGDNILKEIAKILKDNAPEGTCLCRYGGDEFALLTDKCAESCKALAQNMLNKVKQHKFHINTNISISAGIAGGKRRNPRKGNMYKTVTNLINLASLASTKAKKEKGKSVLGYSGIIDEIAI